jgi:hypothetical protein
MMTGTQPDSLAIYVLLAIDPGAVERYRVNLASEARIIPCFVSSLAEAEAVLADPTARIDAVVIDNELGGVFDAIKAIRKAYPRLWVVLVDEEADLITPGRADAATTEPFKDGDLVKKIKRLAEERRLETIQKDALAPVRAFARMMAKAGKDTPRPQVAVDTVQQLGYTYAAYYSLVATVPPSLSLVAQAGPDSMRSAVPLRSDLTTLAGWVAENGQPRIANGGEPPSFVLTQRGLVGPTLAVPVGITLRFGVIVACKPLGGAVAPDDLNALELVGQQLAAALAKEVRSS